MGSWLALSLCFDQSFLLSWYEIDEGHRALLRDWLAFDQPRALWSLDARTGSDDTRREAEE
jgi:hypothetical protein